MFLSSCLFDTDDDGLSSWLSDQGMPSSYKVQMVTVNDLKPTSAELYKDSLPRSAGVFGTFGASAGMVHDAVFDFAVDSAFLADLKAADSAKSYLSLYLFDAVYWSKVLPSTVLPIEDEVNVNISWTLSEKLTDAELNALKRLLIRNGLMVLSLGRRRKLQTRRFLFPLPRKILSWFWICRAHLLTTFARTQAIAVCSCVYLLLKLRMPIVSTVRL